MSESFGVRVKALRKKVGLTQQQLAEKLNIHERTVSKWERNLCEPDFSVYGLLSEALGVSLEELWGFPAPSEKNNGKFDIQSFGKTISIERKKLNESQEMLAKIVGVSPNTVSKWERGVICPDINTFLKLTKHFEVQPSAFYYSICADKGVKGEIIAQSYEKRKLFISLIVFVALAIITGILTLIFVLPVRNVNPPDSGLSKPPDIVNPPEIVNPPDTAKPECEHSYEDKIISASCTAQGYVLHTCTKCGNSFKSDYTSQTEHTAGEWITDKSPTCIQYGSKHIECLVCHTLIQTAQIEKTAHDYSAEIVPPDAQGYGYTLFTCTNCGYSYNDEFTLPTESQLLFSFDFMANTCAVEGIGENAQPIIEIPSYVAGCRVISISSRAFEDCVTLKEIVIPDGVIEIGSYAFHRCVSLKKVVLPDSIMVMEEEAFCGCRLLESVVLPSKLTRLKYSIFSDCASLKRIDIPNTVTVLEDLAFHNCQSLIEVTMSEKLTYIGLYAFYGCGKLTNISIPQSVAYIGDNAFSECSSLAYVKFGNPSGWIAGDEPLSNADLSDCAVAAKYLSDVYNLKIWIKE